MPGSGRGILHIERSSDVHAIADGAGNGTVFLVKTMDPFGGFPVLEAELEMIGNVDPFYYEHTALGLYLSPGLRRKPPFRC